MSDLKSLRFCVNRHPKPNDALSVDRLSVGRSEVRRGEKNHKNIAIDGMEKSRNKISPRTILNA